MEITKPEDQEIKAQLVARVLTLFETLESFKLGQSKAEQAVPPNVNILERDTQASFEQDIEQALGSSSLEDYNRRSGDSSIKPVFPSKWGLTFSGDKKGLSINAFLERVEELRVARDVSELVLLDSGIDLFSGRAYQFYVTCRKEADTWEKLVKLLREKYQPPDYNEKLFEEIKQRTQGSDETMGIYLAVMTGYFKRLTCPVPEKVKLKILLRNIAPFYQQQFCLVDVTSVSQLRTLGRKLEAKREAVENFSAPPSCRLHVFEPDLAYVGEELVSEVLDVNTSVQDFSGKDMRCYNCDRPGHRAIGCLEPRKLRCYRCKLEGYTKRTCPKCSASGNGNRRQ